MKRSYENLLLSYLDKFPCVALIGVRQCGKTTLLDVLPEEWKRFDLERRADFQRNGSSACLSPICDVQSSPACGDAGPTRSRPTERRPRR